MSHKFFLLALISLVPAACGACGACLLRARGFAAAGVPDPTRYHRA
jgi:7-cyano-7-deazaguanine synthase in queuosine biosynthesis